MRLRAKGKQVVAVQLFIHQLKYPILRADIAHPSPARYCAMHFSSLSPIANARCSAG